MAKKKEENPNVRKLTNRGRRSLSLTFPFELVKELGWRPGKKVLVKKMKDGVLVKEVKK